MRQRGSLTREEARLWAALAETVKPLAGTDPLRAEGHGHAQDGGAAPANIPPPPARRVRPLPLAQPAAGTAPRAGEDSRRSAPPRPLDSHGLDAGWERKLAKAVLAPDFTLDLHGHTVGAAHARLDSGLGQAIAMGARLVLVITGRPRPVEAADRGTARGAIRAKVLDWLTLGSHASQIAAVRPAQRRHGGAGALYVVLKRAR